MFWNCPDSGGASPPQLLTRGYQLVRGSRVCIGTAVISTQPVWVTATPSRQTTERLHGTLVAHRPTPRGSARSAPTRHRQHPHLYRNDDRDRPPSCHRCASKAVHYHVPDSISPRLRSQDDARTRRVVLLLEVERLLGQSRRSGIHTHVTGHPWILEAVVTLPSPTEDGRPIG